MKKIITNLESRQIQINLLKEIDCICKRLNLHYYMAYGTLLGAVRHKGFIPWDDDIDICMLRQDYEKLIEVIKGGACEWMSIVDESVDGYYLQFVKAVDNRTIAVQDDTTLKHGIWVDVFPLDNIPKGGITQKLYLLTAFFLRSMAFSAVYDFDSEFSKTDKKRWMKRILNTLSCIIGKKKMFRLYKHFCLRYAKTHTGYVSCLCTQYVRNEILKEEEIKDIVRLEFEGETFNGLSSYDKYLSSVYGDYMVLPPVDKRRTHHVKAWWK